MRKELSTEDIQTITNLPECEMLIKTLQQSGDTVIKTAAEKIKAGSVDQALKTLSPILKTEETQRLIREIGRKIGSDRR